MLTALHVSTVCLCLHWSMQRSTDKSYTIWYLALLVYDYVLTLGDEVELFWRRGPPVSRALMFCCRALVVMYVVTTIIATYIFPLYTTVSTFAMQGNSINSTHYPRNHRRRGKSSSYWRTFRGCDITRFSGVK